MAMQRVVILGGGVGGTLVANLLVRKLRQEIDRREATVTLIDDKGEHVYQPGFMYIAMGGEKAENLSRPGRNLVAARGLLDAARVSKIDEASGRVEPEDGGQVGYDQLVIATGARIVPEELENFDTEAHHFYTPAAALKLREALDAFTGGKIV